MSWRSTTPPPPSASTAAAARQGEASPGRRFTDVPSGGSVFGPTLHIRGSITGADAVEIAGQMEGPIEVEGLVHVAEGARVTGPVSATDAVIEGELQGRLVARGRVELRASAKVRADVHAATVAIAEGCFFDGRIHMGGGGEGHGERGPTHFREKRRRRGRGAGNPEAQPPMETAGDQPAATPDVAVAEPAVEPAVVEPVAAEPAAAEAPAAAAPATPPKHPSPSV